MSSLLKSAIPIFASLSVIFHSDKYIYLFPYFEIEMYFFLI